MISFFAQHQLHSSRTAELSMADCDSNRSMGEDPGVVVPCFLCGRRAATIRETLHKISLSEEQWCVWYATMAYPAPVRRPRSLHQSASAGRAPTSRTRSTTFG